MKRKPGRPRRNWEFEEAREKVRAEGIGSRLQYIEWWILNKPAMLPKRPDRAYKKEFISWNDFLGNNNPFPFKGKHFRPYKEARQFAHTLGLKDKLDWLAFVRTGKKPEDIPARPDVYYQKTGEWFTWKEFLGTNLVEQIKSLQDAPNVFFVLRYPELPLNVYKFGVTNGGLSYVQEQQKKYGFEIIKAYNCEDKFNWQPIVSKTCTKYTMSSITDAYVTTNIFQTLNDLVDYGDLQLIKG